MRINTMVYIICNETKDDNDACVRQWLVQYVKKQNDDCDIES